jgi:hypothetical protein
MKCWTPDLWTLAVAKGEQPNTNGLLTDQQWRKICHVDENIKKVDVVVLTKSEVGKLFTRAKEGIMKCVTSQ